MPGVRAGELFGAGVGVGEGEGAVTRSERLNAAVLMTQAEVFEEFLAVKFPSFKVVFI
jgi:hypothetical protein